MSSKAGCTNLWSGYNLTTMKIKDFDEFIRTELPLEDWSGIDYSLNGLQVGRKEKEIKKVAFAVDACLEVFKRAFETRADLVFVHHGLFWGKVLPIVGPLYKRLEFLLKNDLALYAVHLPLDMDSKLGNNAALADLLSLENIEPFGLYKGRKIGCKGILPEPLGLSELAEKLNFGETEGLVLLPFGPPKIQSLGIVSGGASHEVDQALEAGLDLYITGEVSHSIYHTAEEGGISVLGGGHYKTEIWGVKRVCKRVAEECGIETVFIDLPTGL